MYIFLTGVADQGGINGQGDIENAGHSMAGMKSAHHPHVHPMYTPLQVAPRPAGGCTWGTCRSWRESSDAPNETSGRGGDGV